MWYSPKLFAKFNLAAKTMDEFFRVADVFEKNGILAPPRRQ